MNLVLVRKEFVESGIFGELQTCTGDHICFTLEHAYPNPNAQEGGYAPKLPDGQFVCVRGYHRLENMISSFETFEITGVEGHSGILFHTGNKNEDSSGCVLLGVGQGNRLPSGKIITRSRDAFELFLNMQDGCESFTLTVESFP